MSKCPQCGATNEIVNECRCDPNNLPTIPRPTWRNYGAHDGLSYIVQSDDGTIIRVSMADDAQRLVSILNNHGNNVLSKEELTARFYQVKEQRDRFLEFCRVVCPENPKGASVWDHHLGAMFVELNTKDKMKLCELLDKAASYCPIAIQDEIRAALNRPVNAHPSRMLEALKAIADPEHCLTANSVQGLRDIAQAAMEECDPQYQYREDMF